MITLLLSLRRLFFRLITGYAQRSDDEGKRGEDFSKRFSLPPEDLSRWSSGGREKKAKSCRGRKIEMRPLRSL